jgi:D-sedoheptulose 7-phosphate isomerase
MDLYADWLEAQVAESVRVHESVKGWIPTIQAISAAMVATFRQGGRVFFCGNGGSAADAQHWAAELSGRFYVNRDGLAAISLTTNSSEVTAIGNDFGYEFVFSRPLKALAQKDDMLIGISTSGNSPNVLNAIEVAREVGLKVASFTGKSGGAMKPASDWCICMDSTDVARIQEGHELCGHLLCGLVERTMFGTG